MYYSHTLQDEKFNFFASFLREAIAGKQDYQKLVIPIIKDTHSFTNGQLDIYQIDRSGFPIIVFLADANREYFRNINPENISIENYNYILSMITKQRDSQFVKWQQQENY